VKAVDNLDLRDAWYSADLLEQPAIEDELLRRGWIKNGPDWAHPRSQVGKASRRAKAIRRQERIDSSRLGRHLMKIKFGIYTPRTA
jgi:hypothetical protein